MDSTEWEQYLLQISVAGYLPLIGLEMLISYYGGLRWYSTRDTLNNIILSSINFLLDLSVRMVFGWAMLKFFTDLLGITWEKNWAYWVILFILQDFVYYWIHRLDHTCRLFWAVHNTHHSSEFFNLTVGFRSSVLQPLYKLFFYIPLALLGFEGMDILLVYSLGQLYGILIHTESIYKLGFLEYFMVTPSHHRVHHASNIEYMDRNMGQVFIIWDKLFGTFTAEDPAIPTTYGLTTPPSSQAIGALIADEWKKIYRDLQKSKNWRHRRLYLFGPPGWSHDGSSKTSKQLRELQKKEAAL